MLESNMRDIMKKTAGVFVIFFALFTIGLRAQGEAALPFLEITPNPQSIGLGWTGVSTNTNEPLGYYSNPATLGYSAQTMNLSLQSFTTKSDWLSQGMWTYNASAFSAGYNFKNVLYGLNIGVGLGYSAVRLDFGASPIYYPQKSSNEFYTAYDKYDAYTFGISFDCYVNISAGVNSKKVASLLEEYYDLTGELHKIKADINVLDWGLLLNVPISKLALKDYAVNLNNDYKIKPAANLSLGYSRSNIGDYVSYVDLFQKDPLPLTAKLGYNLSLGADIIMKNILLNLITYDIMVEADNLLINTNNTNGESTYRSGLFGGIKFARNLLQWKTSDNVTLRKAQRVSLFETVSFLYGAFYGEGWDGGRYSNGIVLSTNGWFKVMGTYFNDNGYLKFVFDHLEIQYVSADTFVNSGIGTNLKSISVLFNRFAF